MNMFVRVGKYGARPLLAQRRGYARTRTCPSCGTGLATGLPVCGRCRHIGRVDESVTHHELLGLPYGPNPFAVDTGELKRRFIEAQRQCHPDRWAGRSEEDRERAAAASNAVNRAYKTLLSPMERIGYLLGREGAPMGETDGVDDAELVMEVLDARERVEGSGADGLAGLAEENAEKRREAEGRIGEAVGRADWAAAKRWAVRLKYLVGIEDAITHRRAENADV